MKPSKFFALAGVIEAYQDNGASNLAMGWASIVSKAVAGEIVPEVYDILTVAPQRHTDAVEKSYKVQP